MKSLINLFIGLCALGASAFCAAPLPVKGKVVDETGLPLAYVLVEVIGAREGTATNSEGEFHLSLSSGKHGLRFHALGFQDDTLWVIVSPRLAPLTVILRESNETLGGIEIVAEKRDLGREVLSLAIDQRRRWAAAGLPSSYKYFTKVSVNHEQPDTTSLPDDATDSLRKAYKARRIVLQHHLSEWWIQSFVGPKEEYREYILGNNEYTTDPPENNLTISRGFEYGERDIRPQRFIYTDPYVLLSQRGYREFNIYSPLLDLPGVAGKKILSPLADGALLSYKPDVLYTYTRNGKKIYRVQINPIFRTESLLTGWLDIEEGSWAVIAMDVEVNPYALQRFDFLRWTDEVSFTQDSVLQLNHRSIVYQASEPKNVYRGEVDLWYSEKEYFVEIPERTFGNETRTFSDDAYDLPDDYWSNKRKTDFNEIERKYIERCDSLQNEYLHGDFWAKKDSAFNKLRFMDFVLYGIGYRNRLKNYILYIDPLVAQINPVGIGGYRHRMTVNFSKEFDNNYVLETESFIDYGFRNQDVRGKLGLGLTYVPKKFVRTFIRVGDIYQLINSYASLGSLFSRSNFVRTQTVSISQRMELANGLFGELFLDYSDQKPIAGLQQDRWSGQVFGDVNNPVNFERYIKSEVRLQLQYYHRQKYMIKKNKKILLGSQYPELRFIYRKGIPNVLGSSVNFDYVELTIRQSREMGRWGQIDWEIQGGSFINRRSLRIIEHRFFRGSDRFFFSDPMNSYQLLGPTFSTDQAYFRGNYFHHFNGILLNKIPLLNRLKLTEAAGAGMVVIPESNFRHAEMYIGLERVVRIRRELFRFGVYACSAATSLNKAVFVLKLGVNFFNNYTGRWSY